MTRIAIIGAVFCAGVVLWIVGLGAGLGGLAMAIGGSVRDGGKANVPMGVTGQYGGFGGEDGGRTLPPDDARQ